MFFHMPEQLFDATWCDQVFLLLTENKVKMTEVDWLEICWTGETFHTFDGILAAAPRLHADYFLSFSQPTAWWHICAEFNACIFLMFCGVNFLFGGKITSSWLNICLYIFDKNSPLFFEFVTNTGNWPQRKMYFRLMLLASFGE